MKDFTNEYEMKVETKYKIVVKKVKVVALLLPLDCKEKIEKNSMQPNLKD